MPTIAGPGKLHAISAARKLLRDPRALIDEYSNRYGLIWKTQFPSHGRLADLVWLMGPEGNERILAPQYKDDFSWYEGYSFTMEPIFGRDILFLRDGAEHRDRHRQLVPAFHPRNDADYVAIIRRIIAAHFARWPIEGEFDLAWEIKRLTFHIVANLLLGADDAEIGTLIEIFEELGHGLFSVFRVAVPGFRFYRGLRARRRLAGFIQAKIDRYRASPELPHNMLGSLMGAETETGAALPDESLIAEVIAFLFAGYDTTASLLTSFWVALLDRAELLATLRDESDALGEFTYPSMSGQRWLEAVLLETERLFPPQPFNLRGVVRDFTFQGYEIRAGSKAAYSSYFTGRMERLWERAAEFLPERFLDGKKIPPYAMVGFGGGYRACIGRRFAQLEMRLVVNEMLRAWRLAALPGQSDEVFFKPAMERKHGFRVRARRRD
jgi:cytochrome P450